MEVIFQFGTKAETLSRLSSLITKARILDQVTVSKSDWSMAKDIVWAQIKSKGWGQERLIVRSSASTEDLTEVSDAGRYISCCNILGKNQLQRAIDSVFASYGNRASEDDQVLIQPMLNRIRKAGVILTADMDTFEPYYTVNYSEEGKGDSVTAGNTNKLHTFVIYKDVDMQLPSIELEKLILAARECEVITHNEALDIEFAFDWSGELYLFQVRPMATRGKEEISEEESSKVRLGKLHQWLVEHHKSHPLILGKRPVYGIMPDWNPAEIIGVKPRRLAFSLYKELITDNIWAYQRNNYGYRNMRSHALLLSFLGCPYIDIRLSFNSFIPKGIPEPIADKLINYYLSKLNEQPQFHDKVEFEIVHSCYYLDLPQKLDELKEFGLNNNEIKRVEFALLELTNNVIDPVGGLFLSDLKKIETLKERYNCVVNSELNTFEKIFWLIQDTKRYGTLPFAGIARAAFIAVQLLRSIKRVGIIDEKEHDAFLGSLDSVTRSMQNALNQVSNGSLSRKAFLDEYGHLRPGTYDILSSRYDEAFDLYFANYALNEDIPERVEFSHSQKESIQVLLMEHGIKQSTGVVLDFIRKAIEAREYAKFVFTKSLSQVLKLIGEWGHSHLLSLDDLSHLDINTVLNVNATVESVAANMRISSDIKENKRLYAQTERVKLPRIIFQPDDIYVFYQEKDKPNFITHKKVEADIIEIEHEGGSNMYGKIAFIQSADPGYDYLFTHGITGLVTQYGGANSHMAIRCADLGLPAVIGAGGRYETWRNARRLVIDGSIEQVTIIS